MCEFRMFPLHEREREREREHQLFSLTLLIVCCLKRLPITNQLTTVFKKLGPLKATSYGCQKEFLDKYIYV